MSDETLDPASNTIEIGTERYYFTFETQQFLRPAYVSEFPKHTSVVIVDEPHESSEGHFNIFKGLELFFRDNPHLIGDTIFLSEGTPANQPISVQALIDEEPHPSDDMIQQVLGSNLITGYIAYEWKYQQGIPIIGTEHQCLYDLSRMWASLCRENPYATFRQNVEFIDGTKNDINLEKAWAFAVSARNKYIAQTLIRQVKKYKNPMLFVASGHVVDKKDDDSRAWFNSVKKSLLDAKARNIFGQFMFTPGIMGESGSLYIGVPGDCEDFDIDHYLKQERIGYTFLTTMGGVTIDDITNYRKIFHHQR